MSIRHDDIETFQHRFGYPPQWQVLAPGRVNLIGEHTDYNDGFVMPVAIDRYVRITGSSGINRRVRLFSVNYGERLSFQLGASFQKGAGWSDYIKGVAFALDREGFPIAGWDGVVSGDIPLGAGLSSSAALAVASTRAFAAAGGLSLSREKMATIAREAENSWMGVNCGIMDQMISACGQKGHAVLLDCRDLTKQPVPLPVNTDIMVIDTRTRRELVDSAYNERRNQCEQAAGLLGAASLRDVTWRSFQENIKSLGSTVRKRARHVISENDRTLRAADSMRGNDPQELGRLMLACHASLRDDFDVSCPELNAAVDCAMRVDGCHGARMTGAGFGGCAVALVKSPSRGDFAAGVSACFRKSTGIDCLVYPCRTVDGVALHRL